MMTFELLLLNLEFAHVTRTSSLPWSSALFHSILCATSHKMWRCHAQRACTAAYLPKYSTASVFTLISPGSQHFSKHAGINMVRAPLSLRHIVGPQFHQCCAVHQLWHALCKRWLHTVCCAQVLSSWRASPVCNNETMSYFNTAVLYQTLNMRFLCLECCLVTGQGRQVPHRNSGTGP